MSTAIRAARMSATATVTGWDRPRAVARLDLHGGPAGGDQPALHHPLGVAAPEPDVDPPAQGGAPLLLGVEGALRARRGDLQRVADVDRIVRIEDGARGHRRALAVVEADPTGAVHHQAQHAARTAALPLHVEQLDPGLGQGGAQQVGEGGDVRAAHGTGTIVSGRDRKRGGGPGLPAAAQVARAGRATAPRAARPAVCSGRALFQATSRVEALKIEL